MAIIESTPITKAPTHRRTNKDYLSAPFSYVDITEPFKLPELPKLPSLPMLPGLPNLPMAQSLPGFERIKIKNLGAQYNEYTDPYAVNSMADVLLNKKAKDLILKEKGLSKLDDIPLVGKLAEYVVVGMDYYKRNYAEPLAKGDFGKVAINTLWDVGETTDFGNPLKGFIKEGPKGFERAIGYGNEGRTNYSVQFNSNLKIPKNLPIISKTPIVKDIIGGLDIANMAGEIVLDPSNWFTFGAKSAVTGAAKRITAEVVEGAVKEVSESIAEQAAKDITSELMKTALTKHTFNPKKIVQTLRVNDVDDIVIRKILQNVNDSASISKALSIAHGAQVIRKGNDFVQTAALRLNPFGGLYTTGKGAYNLYDYAYRQSLYNLKKFNSVFEIDGVKVEVPAIRAINESGALEKSTSLLDTITPPKDSYRILNKATSKAAENIDGLLKQTARRASTKIDAMLLLDSTLNKIIPNLDEVNTPVFKRYTDYLEEQVTKYEVAAKSLKKVGHTNKTAKYNAVIQKLELNQKYLDNIRNLENIFDLDINNMPTKAELISLKQVGSLPLDSTLDPDILANVLDTYRYKTINAKALVPEDTLKYSSRLKNQLVRSDEGIKRVSQNIKRAGELANIPAATRVYGLKTNELTILEETLDRIRKNPKLYAVLQDLANETGETHIGAVVNELKKIDPDINKSAARIHVLSNIAARDAKTTMNYEWLRNNIMATSEQTDTNIALLDYLSGKHSSKVWEVQKEIAPRGEVDTLLLKRELEQRINSKARSSLSSNQGYYKYLGLGNKLRRQRKSALGDVDMTAGFLEHYWKQQGLLGEYTIPKEVYGIPVTKQANLEVNGGRVAAYLKRGQDGTPQEIFVDTALLSHGFDIKGWSLPRPDGSKPLPADAFETKEQFINFVIRHEANHSLYPRKAGQTRAAYEDFINQKALADVVNHKAIQEGYQYVVFDMETTGLKAKAGHQLLEVGAKRYIIRNGQPQLMATFEVPVQLAPGVGVAASIKKLTTLPDGTNPMLERVAQSNINQQQAINALEEFTKGADVYGHNIKHFDIPFLRTADMSKRKIVFQKVVDTLDIARKELGYREVDVEPLMQYADTLNTYLKKQTELSTNFIKVADEEGLKALTDLFEQVQSPYALNYVHSQGVKQATRAGVYEAQLLTDSISDVTQLMQDLRSRFANNYVLDSDIIDGNIFAALNGADANMRLQNQFIYSELASHKLWDGDPTGLFKLPETLGEIMDRDLNKIKTMLYSVQRGLDNPVPFNYIGIAAKENIVSVLQNAFKDQYLWQILDNPYERTLSELYAIYKTLDSAKKAASAVGSSYSSTSQNIQRMFNQYRNLNIVDATINLYEDADNFYEAVETVLDGTGDLEKLSEASQLIANTGKNADQVLRNYAIMNAIRQPYSADITDIAETVVATGTDEMKDYLRSNYSLALALKDTAEETTDDLTNIIAKSETRDILSMTPQELHTFMMENPILHFPYYKGREYEGLVDNLVDNLESLQALGLDIEKTPKGFTIYTTMNYVAPETPVALTKYYRRFDTDNDLLVAHAESFDAANKIRTNKLALGPANTAANLIYAEDYHSIASELPDNVLQNARLFNDKNYARDFFKSRDPRLNYLNIGDGEARTLFQGYTQDPFRNTMSLLEDTIKRVDGRNKMIELNFNNKYTINGELWGEFTDEEILSVIKEKPYMTGTILIEDAKGQPVVKTFRIRGERDLDLLRKFDGLIVPKEHANSLIATINEMKYDSRIAQFWYKYVMGTYRTLYVSSIGMVMRNLNDILIKNAVGGTWNDIPTELFSFFKAMQDWKTYNEMMSQIYREYDGLTTPILEQFFRQHPDYDRALFDELHEYATSNVSAGMTAVQQESLKSFYIDGSEKSAAEKLYDEIMFEKNFVTKPIMNLNTLIEHGGRLSNLRMGKAMGLDNLAAYDRVLRTHFDYRSKTKAMMRAELLIPFVTFPIYNTMYWLDNVFTSPWLTKALLTQSRTSLDMEEQKQFTIDNGYKLQNAMLNGNIKIGETIIKLNPSLFDTFQTMTQPDNMAQRLVAPVKQLVYATTGLKDPFDSPELWKEQYKEDPNWYNNLVYKRVINATGTYPLMRPFEQGAKLLNKDLGPERADNLADFVPSIASEYQPNYGALIGQDWATRKVDYANGVGYETYQTQTGAVTSERFYPSIGPRRAYSSRRAPYARRYNSGRYNFYNRWKAQTNARRYTLQPATTEALQRATKSIMYQGGMKPAKMYYNRYLNNRT